MWKKFDDPLELPPGWHHVRSEYYVKQFGSKRLCLAVEELPDGYYLNTYIHVHAPNPVLVKIDQYVTQDRSELEQQLLQIMQEYDEQNVQ